MGGADPQTAPFIILFPSVLNLFFFRVPKTFFFQFARNLIFMFGDQMQRQNSFENVLLTLEFLS